MVFIWYVMIMMFVLEEGRDLCLREMVEKLRKLCNCLFFIVGIYDFVFLLVNVKGYN